MITSQIAAPTVNAAALAPDPGARDSEARPMAEPAASRISEIAAQLTPDWELSTGRAMIASRDGRVVTSIAMFASSAIEKSDENDDRDWNAQKPKKNSAAHLTHPPVTECCSGRTSNAALTT